MSCLALLHDDTFNITLMTSFHTSGAKRSGSVFLIFLNLHHFFVFVILAHVLLLLSDIAPKARMSPFLEAVYRPAGSTSGFGSPFDRLAF